MTVEELSQALTSGLLYPTVGGALVLLSWLWGYYRDGVPLRQQAVDAWETTRGPLVTALGVGASAAVAGEGWITSVALGLTSLLTLVNFRQAVPGRTAQSSLRPPVAATESVHPPPPGMPPRD